ncbi:uncharacterized protein ACRADG_001821 [Cochliomyia hominivorax]
MFKLLVLSALSAVGLAYPSLIGSAPYVSYSAPVATVAYHQPALATVGAVVRTVPTSVSHASHAVVHKSSQAVQDVVAPVIKTTYTAPVYAAAPVSYSSYAAAPLSYSP